jgi:hypothetical protein
VKADGSDANDPRSNSKDRVPGEAWDGQSFHRSRPEQNPITECEVKAVMNKA